MGLPGDTDTKISQLKVELRTRRIPSLLWLSRTLASECLSALANKLLRQESQSSRGGHRSVPVWHCGDPAGWNWYKGLVPWHQADRTGEIEELLEMPLMTHLNKLYTLHHVVLDSLAVKPMLKSKLIQTILAGFAYKVDYFKLIRIPPEGQMLQMEIEINYIKRRHFQFNPSRSP